MGRHAVSGYSRDDRDLEGGVPIAIRNIEENARRVKLSANPVSNSLVEMQRMIGWNPVWEDEPAGTDSSLSLGQDFAPAESTCAFVRVLIGVS